MRAGALVLAAALAVLSTASPLAAQQPEAKSALELAREGMELYERGDFDGAYARFHAAEQQTHAPTLVLWMARAQRRRGKWREARDLLQRVIDERLAPDAIEPFRRAQLEAASDLADLIPRIPHLTIVVKGSGAGRARISLDDTPLPSERLGTPIALDPGRHVIVAEHPGGTPIRREIELAERASERIEIAVETPASPSSSPAPDASRPAPAAVHEPGSLVPAAVLFGVSGAAAVVGAVTGIKHLVDSAALEDRCGGYDCPKSEEDGADETLLLAHVSTASFAVAGAAAIAGIVLAIVRPGGGPQAASWRIQAGPAGAAVVGRFP